MLTKNYNSATREIMVARLPFNHSIIGWLSPKSGGVFVAWERDHPMHRYGTHAINPNGECVNGHYFKDYTEALLDLAERANLIKDLARGLNA